MLEKLLNKFFDTRNNRSIKNMRKTVDHIKNKEKEIEKLSDEQLSAKTIEFRNRIAEGATTNSLLPEAFAVVRQASQRVFGMQHFDVQLIGGIVLNNHSIAEMLTGEGKTLTATLPAYLNALSGKGVHVVTVNDYLAQRDANNNRSLFEFLGLKVGINIQGMSILEKKEAYAADITYGTNNEYGFDYLRDNMAFNPNERVQRKLNYALLDEVDSILIDEARTPLVISGPAEDSSDMYRRVNNLIPYLIRQDKEDSENFQGEGHFSVDEKSRQVHLTERGLVFIEEMLVQANIMKEDESLYSTTNIMLMHHVIAALRAHVIFARDVDYIVKNKEVIIVDEHTGRTMPGRRWSEGLHQAIEAKEKVIIHNENQTLASITFQNYFRLYEKLAGMTGTAKTEAFEFNSIYKLNTITIPTNRPMIRKDLPDLVYMTEKEKIDAIIKDINVCTKRGQPVLVGTISIEKSELISDKLKQLGIKHKVLNAKFHAMEAEIVAQAGQPGAVTIATNMAGRGTDIVLGGNWQAKILPSDYSNEQQITKIKNTWQDYHDLVLASGGLHIIGTERHEARRIDNQLRGRSGRQGDAGSSRFYLSMEDTLMRIFASDRILAMMRKMGINNGEAVEHQLLTKAIANAQRKVESRNFDIRKQLLEYDDVANDQRCVIYAQRNELLDAEDVSATINSIRKDVLHSILNTYIPPQSIEEIWNLTGLSKNLKDSFGLDLPINQWLHENKNMNSITLGDRILSEMLIQYQHKEEKVSSSVMRNIEKSVMLQTLDSLWKEHLAAMDYLRQGIHLRGYAQKDPKQEYKRESFAMFSFMLDSLKHEVIKTLSMMNVHIEPKEKEVDLKKQNNTQDTKSFSTNQNDFSLYKKPQKKQTNNKLISDHEEQRKIGRNTLCPCGSHKKFKYCHGKL